VHVTDNPGLGQDCQGGETVRYDAEWDVLKGKIKGVNVSVKGAGRGGGYGNRGGKGGGKFGRDKGGNNRSAASDSTSLTHSRATLLSHRFQPYPVVGQYHIPAFFLDDGEPPASWQNRARALLTEWKETFQRQTEGAEKPEGAPQPYKIHSEQAV